MTKYNFTESDIYSIDTIDSDSTIYTFLKKDTDDYAYFEVLGGRYAILVNNLYVERGDLC
jgi:hypothetical protein